MLELKGKYNEAKVFTDNVEETAIAQIIELCNQEFTKGSKIRIMPDTHAGAGCTIGTTMTIIDKVVPNLVGVDIGCGMLCTPLGKTKIDMPSLDNFIRNEIPSGRNINKSPQVNFQSNIESAKCYREFKKANEFVRGIGSLGGGNHFIEINIDNEDNQYLVIHSGSRNFGFQIANIYQQKAYDYHCGLDDKYLEAAQNLINDYKARGKKKEIQAALLTLKKKFSKESLIKKELCYLEGSLMKDYLHDVYIAQEYASLNRYTISRRILEFLGLDIRYLYSFDTIHNYINTAERILRKGAISAREHQRVLIPMNMRDGSLICVGKGNPDWNYSAPHGAGRLFSRSKAKELLSLEEFKKSMEGIYTTSVGISTIDEAPSAYKPMGEIIKNITDAVEIVMVIKPIYNFKAGGE